MIRRAALRDDRGESLLELMIAVLILATAVVALGSGIAIAVRTSGTRADMAAASAYLHGYAEQLADAYTCGGSLPAPDGDVKVDGFKDPAVTIRYWNGSSFADSTCSASSDPGVESVRIDLTSIDGRVNETLTVVVRKP